jgi:hypothetical protein
VLAILVFLAMLNDSSALFQAQCAQAGFAPATVESTFAMLGETLAAENAYFEHTGHYRFYSAKDSSGAPLEIFEKDLDINLDSCLLHKLNSRIAVGVFTAEPDSEGVTHKHLRICIFEPNSNGNLPIACITYGLDDEQKIEYAFFTAKAQIIKSVIPELSQDTGGVHEEEPDTSSNQSQAPDTSDAKKYRPRY